MVGGVGMGQRPVERTNKVKEMKFRLGLKQEKQKWERNRLDEERDSVWPDD